MQNANTEPWSVYRRGDTGAWMLRYKDADTGRWRDKRIPPDARVTTQRQAEAWARSWLAEQVREREARANGSELTLGAYLTAWLQRREKNPNVRSTTLKNNKGHIDTHITPALGSVRLVDLTPARCRDFVAALRNTERKGRRKAKRDTPAPKLAPNTVRNIAATLRTVLDDAFDDGHLLANPMRSRAVRHELPDGETRAGLGVVVHIPLRDAERLLACEAVPQERRARYAVGLLSGQRDGEIQGLTMLDADLDAAIPVFDISKAFTTKKIIDKPKSRHAYRKIPIHPLAVRVLRAWKTGGFVQLVGRHAKPTDPLFPDADGRHHRPHSARELRADLALAGCSTTYAGQPIDFHALRRSFATWLAEAGVSEGVRKRLMGHRGAGVTDTHYTAKTLEQLRDAIEQIQLDISAGEVVTLPLRAANAPDPHPADNAQTVTLAAPLAAGVQQAKGESSTISRRRGPDSNRRVTVLQTRMTLQEATRRRKTYWFAMRETARRRMLAHPWTPRVGQDQARRARRGSGLLAPRWKQRRTTWPPH